MKQAALSPLQYVQIPLRSLMNQGNITNGRITRRLLAAREALKPWQNQATFRFVVPYQHYRRIALTMHKGAQAQKQLLSACTIGFSTFV